MIRQTAKLTSFIVEKLLIAIIETNLLINPDVVFHLDEVDGGERVVVEIVLCRFRFHDFERPSLAEITSENFHDSQDLFSLSKNLS